jgi:hypothetical protein
MWFEGSPLDMSAKYSGTMKTLWMIGFYSALCPYLIIFGILTLLLSYWMDKYLLLHRYARPSVLSSDLNFEMIELFEYFPLSIAVGNWFWMRRMGYMGDSVIIYVAVGISAINFIFPSEKINNLIFRTYNSEDLNVNY